MGAAILNAATSAACAHQGNVQFAAQYPRVRVSGQAIAVQLFPNPVGGCTLPPTAGGPCVVATWSNAAKRVKAGGFAVLLDSNSAKCVPTSAPVTIRSAQKRVLGS